ncbi:MAG: mannose-1-phosphate guanylyltransferase [Sedimentibacter saalensis]|uniref:mannose-1-phosphate guanylyltransferase n=1 Tax=Sedimentibacter saalensis TaxID=130788 RepID=UPI002B206988|nr:mannose-1-phosphate guanylyltransferase [Sedimentibacter saalensis]MEA5093469.1 mannose-1-phosphate guanylyltransferase [Sedimentibacter saalensis]
MKTTAVIMAGGKGERFWPRSRSNFPKQFLSLTNDGKTMIQLTAERLLPLVNYEDMFVVTNKDYIKLVKEQLPNIPSENILAEPVAKNTAPAIGLAAAIIQQRYDDSVMIVLPSDHLIKQNQMFLDTLKTAINVAKEGDNLVTIGITPTYPETGYGYINYGQSNFSDKYSNVYKVERFVEKPNVEKAKEYLESGNYIWNSGMFVWKVSTILENIKLLMNETYNGLMDIKNVIGKANFEDVLYEKFSHFKSESIDYGVMERAVNIYTIPGTFGWDDVGSWLALERISKTNEYGNSVTGNVITINSKNSIISGTNKLIATVGIEDLIIVDTDDAILICSKESTQDVKKVLENLKICNRTEYI